MDLTKRIIFIFICLIVIGCASNPERVGSDAWHEQRIAEIEQSYTDKEINKAEYLKLKNDTDEIKSNYYNRNKYSHGHVGYGSHRGTTIGVGVGF